MLAAVVDSAAQSSKAWAAASRGPARGLISGLNSPSSGTVHRCSPRSCLRSSRTVADAG